MGTLNPTHSLTHLNRWWVTFPRNWATKRAAYGRCSIHGASFTSTDSAVSLALGARRSCGVCRRTPDRSRCHTRHWPTEDCEFHSQNSSTTSCTHIHCRPLWETVSASHSKGPTWYRVRVRVSDWQPFAMAAPNLWNSSATSCTHTCTLSATLWNDFATNNTHIHSINQLCNKLHKCFVGNSVKQLCNKLHRSGQSQPENKSVQFYSNIILGPDLQNILRFILRLSLVCHKFVITSGLKMS